ncbi:hypothetical protein WOLCODRAFT_102597 [Wolfiporia cocos MD-104 SS10]|uniref:NAD(P)-binding protein n=1 Tax=Wolfiporia cocos (strain MD-104) TaxID=742152 RepID=A0A2H3K2Y3_WOLCO|nr:hypothetical protein WOLCODRAFT_102597 [Wolfiporia cocos MD-104 SS10]
MVRPIIIVTGANGGVGFGVCHRLLVQLSQPQPPDAQPVFAKHAGTSGPVLASASEGVTIIMACRDLQRAGAARAQLYGLLDTHIAKIPRGTKEHEYALEFQRNVALEIHRVDLSSVRSVFDFGKEVSQKYPYISHLICNAGLATYSHLDYWVFFRQVFEDPLDAVRHPMFNVQKSGAMSQDNLGHVWQCNVFGHYVMYRTLQPLLSRYSSQFDTASEPLPQARVLWMSSVDALATYDPDTDWQLTKTDTSYQSSKAQIDFLVMELARRDHVPTPSSPSSTSPTSPAIGHYLVSPGITATKMAAELLRPYILELCMLAFFYFVRMLGSPHVNFATYKSAVAASHVTLAPARCIPTTAAGEGMGEEEDTRFPKLTVFSDRLGRERVGIDPVAAWDKHPDEGARILERCERLYQAFVEREKGSGEGTANGNGHAASP